MRAHILSALGTRGFTLLLTFAANIVAARALGVHARGELAVMLAIPGFIAAIGSAGLETANLYFSGLSRRSFVFVTRWSILHSIVVSFLLGSLYLLLVWRFDGAAFGLSHRQVMLSISASPIVLMAMLLGVAEAGRKRLVVYNVSVAGSIVLYLAAVVFLAVSDTAGAKSVFCAYLGAQTVTLIALLCSAKPWVSESGTGPRLGEFLRYGTSASTVTLTQYALLRSDTLMIQALAGSSAVGLYAIAYSLSESLYLIAVAVNLVLLPRLARSELPERSAFSVALVTMVASAVCAFGLAVTAPFLIPLAFGNEFSDADRLLWVLLPGTAILNFGRVLQSQFSSMRQFRPSFVASVLSLLALIAIELLLIPKYGATGAAIASSFAYTLFSAMIFAAFVLRTNSPRKLPKEVSSSSPREFRYTWAPMKTRSLQDSPSFVIQRLSSSFRRPVALAIVCILAIVVGGLIAVSPLPIITIFAGAFLLSVFFRPVFGLLCLAVIAPITVPLSSFTSMSPLLITAVLVPTLGGLFISRRAVWPREGLVYLLLSTYFMFSWLTGEAVSGGDTTAREGVLIAITLIAPLLLLPLYPVNRESARWVPPLVAGSIVFASAWYLLNARDFLGSSNGSVDTWIVVSNEVQAGNHNVLGALIIIAVAVLLPRLVNNRNLQPSVIPVLALMVLTIAALFSFSRSTYIALALMLVVFAMLHGVRTIAVASTLGIVSLQLMPQSVWERIAFTSSGSGGNLDTSSAVRLDLWRAASSMFADHPIFGVGLYQFVNELPHYWLPTSTSISADVNPAMLMFAHNTVLSIASQLGLLGLILVGKLAWTISMDSWRSFRVSQAATGGESALLALLGIGIASMFGEPLFTPAILVPFVLVIGSARQQMEFS